MHSESNNSAERSDSTVFASLPLGIKEEASPIPCTLEEDPLRGWLLQLQKQFAPSLETQHSSGTASSLSCDGSLPCAQAFTLNPECDPPHLPPPTSHFSQLIIPHFKLNQEELWGEQGFTQQEYPEADADISPVKVSGGKVTNQKSKMRHRRFRKHPKVSIYQFFRKMLWEAQMLLA